MKRTYFYKDIKKQGNYDIQVPSDNLKTNYFRMKSIFTIIFICAWVTLKAQTGYQNIVDKRINYLSAKISFTPDEAQKFWPLFREYHNEREKITKRRKNLNTPSQDLSQDEYLKIISEYIDAKVKQALLLEQYNKKYLEILPPQKVLELYKFDEEFNKHLLKQIKKSKRNN